MDFRRASASRLGSSPPDALVENIQSLTIRANKRLHSGGPCENPSRTQNRRQQESTSSPITGPIPSRPLSKREQILVLKGSKLHGCIFPPWKDPLPDEFDLKDGEAFVDSLDLRLSDDQLAAFAGWRRARENLPLSCPKAVVDQIDLVQDLTNDCSVVASLCAGTARAERGHPSLLSSIMYPLDGSFRMSTPSPNGKYVLRLNFNGCFRRVVIDDRLPTSNSERCLYVSDRRNPQLLWPALVEKAYMKVRGGYDFPGSNSGTDLWVLTGWIPEQIFLQTDEVMIDSFWKRIYAAHSYGDILMTLGTGKLTRYEEQCLGLAGEHDYAVIDMREDADGRRSCLIKNPWSRGCVWKGSSGIMSDAKSDEVELTSQNKPDNLTPGTYWMDIYNIFQHFQTAYLNWNPGLFQFRQDIHFSWDLEQKRSAAGSFNCNPQYVVQSDRGRTVWLLLSMHFKDRLQSSPEVTDCKTGYMSLYAFDNGGKRTLLTDGAVQRSPYVDASNSLLKLDLPPRLSYTVVVSEQELPASDYAFSLSVFSFLPLTLQEAPDHYTYSITRDMDWTYTTAGGNMNSPAYYANPQTSLSVQKRSDIAVLIASEHEDYSVHVKLIWASDKRATHITKKDIVGDSGDYRKGSALAEMRGVDPGIYTIVCSTFESGQYGKFSITVRSMTECTLKHVPLEGAGCLVKTVPRPSFIAGLDRVLAPIMVQRISRIYLRARTSSVFGMARSSPLRLTIEYGQGPNKSVMAISGEGDFVDNPTGLQIDDIDIIPQMCQGQGIWLVLERLGGSQSPIDDAVDIQIYSESSVEIGAWGQEL